MPDVISCSQNHEWEKRWSKKASYKQQRLERMNML